MDNKADGHYAPVVNIRDGFIPQTGPLPGDPRGDLPNPEFDILSVLDNGGMVNAVTNEVTQPVFGNY